MLLCRAEYDAAQVCVFCFCVVQGHLVPVVMAVLEPPSRKDGSKEDDPRVTLGILGLNVLIASHLGFSIWGLLGLAAGFDFGALGSRFVWFCAGGCSSVSYTVWCDGVWRSNFRRFGSYFFERKPQKLSAFRLGFGVPYFNTFFLKKNPYEKKVYTFFSLVT